VLPAWTPEEKEFALVHGADQVVLLTDHAALMEGFSAAMSETTVIAENLPVDAQS
jgi:4-hydroxy-2-oxoheptanedioate aldolase